MQEQHTAHKWASWPSREAGRLPELCVDGQLPRSVLALENRSSGPCSHGPCGYGHRCNLFRGSHGSGDWMVMGLCFLPVSREGGTCRANAELDRLH